MNRARNASHDGGPAMDATVERGARVSELLRRLRLVAVAIVTIVCAGIVSPALGGASPSAHGVTALEGVAAVQGELAQQWRHHGARPVVPPHAEEANIDDDDIDDDDVDGDGDAHSVVAEDPVASCRRVRLPRKCGRALRGEAQSDTSRFAMGRGLARGPPV